MFDSHYFVVANFVVSVQLILIYILNMEPDIPKSNTSTLKSILKEFKLSGADRECLLTASGEESTPHSFKIIASSILSGHFLVTSDNKPDVEIHPTSIEFYFHEEDTCSSTPIKDYIVYHKGDKEYYPLGMLHNHISGIDLTFEKEDSKVRASVLIREFSVIYSDDDSRREHLGIKPRDGRSTYCYPALFSQFSVFDGFSVRWVDGDDTLSIDKIEWTARQNVMLYDSEGRKMFDDFNGKYVPDNRALRASVHR